MSFIPHHDVDRISALGGGSQRGEISKRVYQISPTEGKHRTKVTWATGGSRSPFTKRGRHHTEAECDCLSPHTTSRQHNQHTQRPRRAMAPGSLQT